MTWILSSRKAMSPNSIWLIGAQESFGKSYRLQHSEEKAALHSEACGRVWKKQGGAYRQNTASTKMDYKSDKWSHRGLEASARHANTQQKSKGEGTG